MLRTILVPLDGSTLAEQALPYACRLARQTGAELVLVRAAPHAANAGSGASPLRVTVRDAEAYLASIWQQLTDDGLVVHAEALHSDPVRAIIFIAHRYGADLIVMSTHGHSGLHRLLLGSVAEAVVQQTVIPVFLVRASNQPRLEQFGFYRKILVPLDGTPFAEAALPYLQGSGCGREAEILLLHALSMLHPFSADLPGMTASPEGDHIQTTIDEEQVATLEYLAQAAQRYLKGHTLRTAAPVSPPGPAIIEAANDFGVDFIVMVTHGRTGLDRFAHGSVANYVLRHASMPVLLLHGTTPAAPVQDEVSVTLSK